MNEGRHNATGAMVAVVALCIAPITAAYANPVVIGREARTPDMARSHYSRYVNFRPADGEGVKLNPPRFSWPYWSDWPGDFSDALHSFTLQISSNREFHKPAIEVKTPYNFYNTLPALKGADRWFWRVGYDVGTPSEAWTKGRSFAIDRDGVVWNRSRLADPDLAERGHPRILFSEENLPQIRRLRQVNPASKAAWNWLVARAEDAIKSDWWKNFPKTDREQDPKEQFYRMAHDLAVVAFVWRVSGDDKYAGVKDRAVTLASYPQGGRASPEGAGGDANEDSTQTNELLALLFDWLYQDLNEREREIMIKSLEWRIDYWMNSFAWRRKGSGGAMARLTFRKGSEHLGDKRLYMEPTKEWKRFDWSIPVTKGADYVHVDLFNYYRQGVVWWDSFELRAVEKGANLIRNSDFAMLSDGHPEEWRFSDYRTGGAQLVSKTGGRRNTPALGISCQSSSQRGSWAQGVKCAGVKTLHATGWYRTERTQSNLIRAHSLSGCISSHQFEGSMDSAVMGLALYEHSEIAREWFDLILNYMIGVTNGFGFDESWNEGPGYGNSKMKWLMNATLYYDTALPYARLGRNPYYRAIGDFFCRVTPVGLPHSPWGNGSASEGYYRGGRLANFRKLAFLTGEGRFLKNWRESGGGEFSKMRPFIEYVLPHYYNEPKEELESDCVRLFRVAGWVTASSRPPSSRQGFDEAVGIIFQSRPRGGYSHSFNSDNSFQIHAYGQQVNHGGGSTTNKDAYAYHTMSHNTILVDGLGQAQPTRGQPHPWYSRVVGFERGDDYVYFAGDATNAYPHEPGRYGRWGLPLSDIYEKRGLGHLKRFIRHVLFIRNRYFVIFDDLQASKPAKFTWLYHILPAEPFDYSAASSTFRYTVGDVPVLLSHIAYRDNLTLQDRRGEDALINPFTGEDYRKYRRGDLLCGHNLWITSSTPRMDFHFLAVVYPFRQSEPEPRVERLDDWTVRVGEDVISFDPGRASQYGADFVVDVSAMREE